MRRRRQRPQGDAGDETARKRLVPRRVVFLGKTSVHSAGVMLMSGFPREDRYRASDAVLLIYYRQLDQDLSLSSLCAPGWRQLHGKIEAGIEVEVQAFEKLIAAAMRAQGRAAREGAPDWYVPARRRRTGG